MLLSSIIKTPSLQRAAADFLPRRSWDRTLIVAPLALLAISCLLTAFVPPADDEFYYWCWAQSLQWSYYDHPVMSALMIRASGDLFGHSMFALRFPACVTTAFVFGVILYLTRPRSLAWALLVTPVFSLGSVIVTPDTPLLLFWAAYALWLVKAHEKLDAGGIPVRHWLLGGVLLGCGVLGKYTMALAVPAGFVSFLLAGNFRQWIRGYILHGIVSFVVTLPILIFNIQNDFAPILYQWKHAMGPSKGGLAKFGEFVGIQLVLFGTLPVVLLPWVLRNWKSFAADPRLRVCFALYALPFSFFLYKATQGHLEGNWALASYITFWPLAAIWYEHVKDNRFWKWGAILGFAAPALAVLVMTVHLIHPLPGFTPTSDRITRQSEKYELAAEMAAVWRAQPEQLPLFAETYQWVALLRFHGIDARQIDGLSRRSHFTQHPEVPSDVPKAFVLWEGPVPAAVRPGLNEPVKVTAFPLTVRGGTVTVFDLWRVERSKQ
ncbi:glycosyltransferase family 39 protein [soil metagenome]